jgi:SAM-dependent methyltransferase
MKNNQQDEWWTDFYGDLLADVLLETTSGDEIAQTLGFLQRELDVTAGRRVLDQCCGNGRLSHALAEEGVELIGIDIIPGYIDRAREGGGGGGRCEFEVADAFKFVADPPCDAVFNWWTSFGYALEDEKNLAMIERAFESLRPGGKFALDFMNVPGIYRHFLPHVITRAPHAEGEITLLRESEIDLQNAAIRKNWTYYQNGKLQAEHESVVRLYEPSKLSSLFSEAGFVNVTLFGGLDSSPVTIDSPRCIVTGTKP